MSLLHGVTDILSHLLTDQIDLFGKSIAWLHFYLAESSIAQYSYTIKSFCLELLHPERQVVSDWWSLAVIILDCFSYENFESKREFVVYVQWPAAHSARGRESKTLKESLQKDQMNDEQWSMQWSCKYIYWAKTSFWHLQTKLSVIFEFSLAHCVFA